MQEVSSGFHVALNAHRLQVIGPHTKDLISFERCKIYDSVMIYDI